AVNEEGCDADDGGERRRHDGQREGIEAPPRARGFFLHTASIELLDLVLQQLESPPLDAAAEVPVFEGPLDVALHFGRVPGDFPDLAGDRGVAALKAAFGFDAQRAELACR